MAKRLRSWLAARLRNWAERVDPVPLAANPYSQLFPFDGPVRFQAVDREVVYAKDQPEYLPLRCLRGTGPDGRVVSRWTFDDQQRRAVATGADLFLTALTFRGPLQPVMLHVGRWLPPSEVPE